MKQKAETKLIHNQIKETEEHKEAKQKHQSKKKPCVQVWSQTLQQGTGWKVNDPPEQLKSNEPTGKRNKPIDPIDLYFNIPTDWNSECRLENTNNTGNTG